MNSPSRSPRRRIAIKRLGGREIDDKLELSGLLDRQVGRLLALGHLINIRSRTSP